MTQFEEPLGPTGRLPKQELYLFGAAMQFFDERSGKAERNRMGYHMTKMN